ncbi:DUF5980 family protein [Streptomyces tagetis]|uniref:Uncharacterized protein n=1 Tax=Streptomyces tagetis TaxID=2820809 RepID=A0A940XDU9_9ACTN|nr:DUF5980 family protein [Streptomyces sp. RG38]MBQ0826605.1 hypothetical protein [Streptomyces sp. RG38]
MRTSNRAAGLLVGLTSALTLTLANAAPSAASTATWTLEAQGQRICVSPQYGHPNTYALAPVSGTWSAPITTGVRNLPPGSSSVGGTTIPPGTNDPHHVNGFVGLSIAPAPAGEYTAEIWATDGTVTQTDSLLIVFRAGC